MTTESDNSPGVVLCLRVLEGPATGAVIPFDYPRKAIGDAPPTAPEERLELNDPAAELNWVIFTGRETALEGPHLSLEIKRRATDLWHNGFLVLGRTCDLYPADLLRLGESTLRVERLTLASRPPAYRLFPWENMLSFPHPEASRIFSSALTYAAWLDGARFLDKAIEGYVINREATARGLEVDDESLQAAADTFRNEKGLLKAVAFRGWLKQRRLTLDGWEEMLVEDLLRAKLRAQVVSDDRISEYFALNRRAFDEIELAVCQVPDEGVAAEIAAQAREATESFFALTRLHSTDQATRASGGYRGWVKRPDVFPTAEDTLFSHAPGTLHGPVFEGRVWTVYLVMNLRRAVLDPATRERISALLFAEWLRPLVAQESFQLSMAE